MKRTVTAFGAFLTVSMLFTGCSSLAGSLEVDSSQIEHSVEASQGGFTADIQEIAASVPDYFKKNMEEKFRDLGGERAFQIKDGHSQDPEDMEQFQVGALLEDGTFIYGYATRMDQSGRPREMVHCGAFYNYLSKEFQVFHETSFRRDGESQEETADISANTEESFSIQVCGQGDEREIFVYDNGHGYLYRMDGQLKFHADIESLVRRQYPGTALVSMVHAMADGEDRIYLELAVEKEPIEVPQEVPRGDVGQKDPESLKDDEEELQKLDEELSGKVESMILVYEFNALSPVLHQENLAFEAQKQAWVDMADGQTFDEADRPNSLEDWNMAVEQHPDDWGGVDVDNMEKLPVYEWKGEPAFKNQGDLCTFVPKGDAYREFRDLREDLEFDRQFIPYEGHYSQLYGKTGKVSYPERESFKRTFTLSRKEERQNDEGNPVTVTVTWDVTQTLKVSSHHRYASLNNAYTETYWILDQGKALYLENAVGNHILCSNEDSYSWILPGGELKDGGSLNEGRQVRAMEDGNRAYLLFNDSESMEVKADDFHSGSALDGYLGEMISYSRLDGTATEGDTVYDDAFQELNESKLPGGFNGYGGVYLTEENLLKTGLSADFRTVARLTGLGADVFVPSGKGFLITHQDKGILYYDTEKQRSLKLLEGSWYRSFKRGNRIISIGFLKDGAYKAVDMAFSRVYEYDLQNLMDTVLAKMLEDILDLKEQERESASIRAEEDRTRESRDPEETVEDMLDGWEKKHPKEKREKEASQAMEELNQ